VLTHHPRYAIATKKTHQKNNDTGSETLPVTLLKQKQKQKNNDTDAETLSGT
jgi:hypothetical protein